MAENREIVRSYTDNYAIKEFIKDTLVPKYFPNTDISLRTVGMVGLTSELISNIAEDSFNATSVLFREAFPNRAELPESIYSHAAIFQLSNIFSQASACTFLLVLEESSIINNMEYDESTKMYYFYIDKNTTVYVENIPYSLDYDVRIRCVKKTTSNNEQYIFTASYILDDYTNSISDITDPYIKIRRSNNGFIALEVKMHQMTRDIHYEPIINNSKINMPTIDIKFDGQLVGFDVLYKTAEDSSYNTQLQKLLIYSQPISTPFCYYQLYDDNTLSLSFNAKESYFTPKFNSELQVILYISKGKEANFDAYTGSNITITPDNTVYNYEHSVAMAAAVLSASTGGADKLSIDELQSLTIEGYRTANALTTEQDLSTYFSNYKTTYGDFLIKFIKRRNDIYERIFGGYCIMQYESEIFKTNTLDLHMNLSDMIRPDPNSDIYMIEPGTVFTYTNDTDTMLTFYRDTEKYEEYYAMYEEALGNGNIPFVEGDHDNIPEYLKDADGNVRSASYAEFKARNGYNDRMYIFDMGPSQIQTFSATTDDFRFVNPFLIRFKKSPNLVSLYQTHINERSTVDFTNQNDETFVQFVTYQIQVERYFEKNKEYRVTSSIMPSITLDSAHPVIKKLDTDPITGETRYNINNKYTLDQNDLRVLFVIYDKTNNNPLCYSEMYPISFTSETTAIYETKFSTDDYITPNNELRIKDGTIYLVIDNEGLESQYNEISNGYYFKKNDDVNNSFYSLYTDNNELTEYRDVTIDEIDVMISNSKVKKFSQMVRMSNVDGDILIPMENVQCKLFTLYKKKYDDENSSLVDTDDTDTDNIFVEHDDTYNRYIWTNEYTTATEPLTFIKTLTHVRSHLYFENYTETNDEGQYKYDIMDVRMESLPFVKWDIAYDKDIMTRFMSVFTSQYESLTNVITEKLRNETSIDCKFYNTYGRSTNYFIGEEEKPLNTLNLKIGFDIWFIAGTDTFTAIPEIKQFIKEKIETIYDNGTNQIHVSNLMRDIEYNYSYVDHIRFLGFNEYSTEYQSIKLKYTNIDAMSKEERRKYVPELLVIDIEDILINEYLV